MAAIGGLGSLYATPEVRMRATSQPVSIGPLGEGSGTLVQVGDLRWPDEAARAGAPGQVGFADLLEAGIRKTNELSHLAEAKAEAFAAGRLDDLHGTMISAKEAEISLRLVGNVRTKLLDAFHELWRINV